MHNIQHFTGSLYAEPQTHLRYRRQIRGIRLKTPNIIQSILRNPKLTTALLSTRNKNKSPNHQGKRKHKRKAAKQEGKTQHAPQKRRKPRKQRTKNPLRSNNDKKLHGSRKKKPRQNRNQQNRGKKRQRNRNRPKAPKDNQREVDLCRQLVMHRLHSTVCGPQRRWIC